MYPPIFTACNTATVQAVLGSNPLRLYPFGEAPQNVNVPYAVWQIISGMPENYIGDVPDIDFFTIQVDVYASSASSARAIAEIIRDEIEQIAYIAAWRGESREPDTRYYRYSFDVDWHVNR